MKIPKASSFRRLLILVLGCMAAGAATSANAGNIAWSAASGKPKTPIGERVAFYVWHQGNTVYLYTTGVTKSGQSDRGSFVLKGGTISGLTRVQLENTDKLSMDGKNKVIFNFVTAEGIDGLHFKISGGTTLTLTGSFNGGAYSDLIRYGKNATPSKANPVTFDLTK
jgi:hypothetical protein